MAKTEYLGSRICYIVEETSRYLQSLLITGAFLAKLTTTLGFSDSLTAILGSFVSLGCGFQLLAMFIFRKGRVKRRVSILFTLSQLLFTFTYVIPLVEMSQTMKIVLFIIFLLGGYFLFNIVFAPKTNWFMSLIPDKERGVFTSIKEGISLVFGILFQFVMGIVMDKFEAANDLRGAFVVCAITIFVMTVIHTLSLVLAKEKEPVEKKKTSVFKEFKDTFSDKDTIKIILVNAIWSIGVYITIPFLGTYQIKELEFSMTYVGALTMAYSAARVICSVFLGRYADKHSFAKMLNICYIIAAGAFLAVVLSNRQNGYIVFPIHGILYAMSQGGTNSAVSNLVFDYIPPERRTGVLAANSTLGGISGFLATLAATPIVEYIQSRGSMIFGMTIYAQQILAGLSFLIIVFLMIYVRKVVYKIKPYSTELEL